MPLWDPQLAAEEVRRCAAKGSYAIAFSENPSKLGFPSLYTGEWDVLWQACQETDTTGVDAHRLVVDACRPRRADAPLATSMSLYAQNAQGSLCDWVFSGTLERFPDLKIAYAESQVGWMPFQLERMDASGATGVGGVDDVTVAPSEQVQGRVYGCVFDDLHGLQCRDAVGLDHILFETDYPHSDGTFPHSRKVAHELFVAAGMDADDCYKVLRGNAIDGLRPAALRHHEVVAPDQLPGTDGLLGHVVRLNVAVGPRARTASSVRAGISVRRLPGAGGGPALAGPPQRPDGHLRRARPHHRGHVAHPRPPREGRAGAPPARPRRPPPGRRRGDRRGRGRWPSRSTPSCTAGRTRSPPTTPSATSWRPPWPASPS